MYIYMHVCTYTHLYIHIYFTAYNGPLKHQRVMSGRRNISYINGLGEGVAYKSSQWSGDQWPFFGGGG